VRKINRKINYFRLLFVKAEDFVKLSVLQFEQLSLIFKLVKVFLKIKIVLFKLENLNLEGSFQIANAFIELLLSREEHFYFLLESVLIRDKDAPFTDVIQLKRAYLEQLSFNLCLLLLTENQQLLELGSIGFKVRLDII
jgi:hypothetical protein